MRKNTCFVKNCPNHFKQIPSLPFFCLPRDPVRSNKWLVNSGRKDLFSKGQYYLDNLSRSGRARFCALHFEDSQFTDINKNRLNWNAVPTLFDEDFMKTLFPEKLKFYESLCKDVGANLIDKNNSVGVEKVWQHDNKMLKRKLQPSNHLGEKIKKLRQTKCDSPAERVDPKCTTSACVKKRRLLKLLSGKRKHNQLSLKEGVDKESSKHLQSSVKEGIDKESSKLLQSSVKEGVDKESSKHLQSSVKEGIDKESSKHLQSSVKEGIDKESSKPNQLSVKEGVYKESSKPNQLSVKEGVYKESSKPNQLSLNEGVGGFSLNDIDHTYSFKGQSCQGRTEEQARSQEINNVSNSPQEKRLPESTGYGQPLSSLPGGDKSLTTNSNFSQYKKREDAVEMKMKNKKIISFSSGLKGPKLTFERTLEPVNGRKCKSLVSGSLINTNLYFQRKLELDLEGRKSKSILGLKQTKYNSTNVTKCSRMEESQTLLDSPEDVSMSSVNFQGTKRSLGINPTDNIPKNLVQSENKSVNIEGKKPCTSNESSIGINNYKNQIEAYQIILDKLKRDHKSQLKTLRKEIKNLRVKSRRKDLVISILKKYKKELKSSLKNDNLISKSNFQKDRQLIEEIVSRYVSKDTLEIIMSQIKKNTKSFRNRWTNEVKLFALNIFQTSPKAYNILCSYLELPSPITLERFLRETDSTDLSSLNSKRSTDVGGDNNKDIGIDKSVIDVDHAIGDKIIPLDKCTSHETSTSMNEVNRLTNHEIIPSADRGDQLTNPEINTSAGKEKSGNMLQSNRLISQVTEDENGERILYVIAESDAEWEAITQELDKGGSAGTNPLISALVDSALRRSETDTPELDKGGSAETNPAELCVAEIQT